MQQPRKLAEELSRVLPTVLAERRQRIGMLGYCPHLFASNNAIVARCSAIQCAAISTTTFGLGCQRCCPCVEIVSAWPENHQHHRRNCVSLANAIFFLAVAPSYFYELLFRHVTQSMGVIVERPDLSRQVR